MEDDIKAMLQLKGGQQSNLGGFLATVAEDSFFRLRIPDDACH